MKPGGNYRWVICGLLFFSVAINYIDRLVIGILKEPLSQALGWNEVDYGNIAAAFSFAYAFGYLIGGRSMDRFGVKRGLPLFVLAWSIAATAHGLVALIGLEEKFSLRYPWFSWTEKGFVGMTLAMPMTAAGFMFARIALGLTEGANFPGAIKATAEWFPVKERAMATGLFNAGSNVGAVLCPIAVPWMFKQWGWPATFYITGALGFIWVAVWWWIYEAPEKQKKLSQMELNYIKEGQPLTEERPPARLPAGARVYASMLCDGVYVGENATVESSVLSPGVVVRPGAVVRESIIATDCVIESGAVVERAILDKGVHVESGARVGWGIADQDIRIAMVGKHSVVPAGYVIEPEAQVGTDVIASDYDDRVVHAGQIIETRRQANEV